MNGGFLVVTTKTFDRSLKRLAKQNSEIVDMFESLLRLLEHDPHNISRRLDIKKLTAVESGDGQWRIRSGVYRLRYDIDGNRVILHSINHRRQAYGS